MGSIRTIVLVCLLSLMVINVAFAATAAKTVQHKTATTTVEETPKAAQPTQPTQPKQPEQPTPPKQQTPPQQPPPQQKPQATEPKKAKPTTAPLPTEAGFSVERVQKIAQEYYAQAKAGAEKLWANSQQHLDTYSKAALGNANAVADKYLAVEQAKWVKANLFNVYGVLAGVLAFITLSLTASKITWVFSLNYLRAFLSAFGLGVFFTLYGLSLLIKDPATLVAKNSPEVVKNFENVTFAWFSLLVALNAASLLKFSFKNVLQFVASGLLFIEEFGFKDHLEAQMGTLPAHALELAVFSLLSVLSFAQLEASATPIVITSRSTVYPAIQTKVPVVDISSPSKDGKKVKKSAK